MKVDGKSFGIGVATTLVVIAIFAWPYRAEIMWAYKNRKTLGAAADVGSSLSSLGSLFK